METTNAFLGDQPTGPRPPNYEPAPGTSGGYPQPPANQPGVNTVSMQPPKQPEAQNINAYAVPDANVAPAAVLQNDAANQNRPMPLEVLAGFAAQEMGMLASRLDERQFQAIAHTMQAHPVSQGIQQDVVRIQQEMLKAQQHMAGNAIASMLAVNTVIKLHLAYPQLPVEGIVNDVMGVVGHFKQNQDQPGHVRDGIHAQMGFGTVRRASLHPDAPAQNPLARHHQPQFGRLICTKWKKW